MSSVLGFMGPLEWEAMLAYFRARAIPGVEHVTDDAYRRTVAVDGRVRVLELMRGGPDQLHLRGPQEATERARRIFSLDAPVERAAAALAPDPLIGPLLSARPGLRVPGTWDPFETGIRAIIGQQVSVAGANTLVGRLVGRLGTRVPGDDHLSHAFPRPPVLAAADLNGLGLPGARAAAINAFAAAVRREDVRLDGTMTLDELTGAITAVRGLGPWTAHYIALRLGEPDAFPANDLGLRRALARLAPAEAERRPLAELAARWSPWRATAAIHLWQAPASGASGGVSRRPGRRR